MKGFSKLTTPLTDLTKKDDFQWDEDVEISFQRMKEEMNSCPVFSLPYFSKPFVLECDASGEFIGEDFKKNQHPIAFEIRKL